MEGPVVLGRGDRSDETDDGLEVGCYLISKSFSVTLVTSLRIEPKSLVGSLKKSVERGALSVER